MKLFRSSHHNRSQPSLPSSPSRSNSPDQPYLSPASGVGVGFAAGGIATGSGFAGGFASAGGGGVSSGGSGALPPYPQHFPPPNLQPAASQQPPSPLTDQEEVRQQEYQHQPYQHHQPHHQHHQQLQNRPRQQHRSPPRPRSELFSYPPPPSQELQQQHLQQLHDSQIHSHPAHALSRPSIDLPVAPVVQTQFGASRSVHVATQQPTATASASPDKREIRRSKRSIFGLTSSSASASSSNRDRDRDRDSAANAAVNPSLGPPPVLSGKKAGRVGRSNSIHLLRKPNPALVSASASSSTSASGTPRASTPEPQSPIPQQQQQQQQQQQNQAAKYKYNNQENQEYQAYQAYQAYQPQDEQQTSDRIGVDTNNTNYVAFHDTESGHQQYPQPYQHQHQHQPGARSVSRTSFGPPSPATQASPTQVGDSKPPKLFSAQSPSQAAQQLQTMARDHGGQNGSMRHQQQQHQQHHHHQQQQQQQQQQQSARESRDEELRQYHQDNRTRAAQQYGEQGHQTPPPATTTQSGSRSKEDPRDMDFNQLVHKYEELQAKYSKVKRYYFEREAQVTQLQNTVATQRLSMSKTSLDDAQYQQRFERLSGAINNLAFNIRKDWKHVVPWLRAVCNHDAHTTGTKEMTAIGRACIARWLAEQVFDRVFHPALPQDISRFLKATEKTLRRQGQGQGQSLTEEQRDDHTIKITTWRLTTIEGLSDHFNSPSAAQTQDALVNELTDGLTRFLKSHLKEPSPAGLQEGVGAIVQLALSIVANMPLESRDIYVEYYLPGESINETYMKVETGLMPLTHPGLDERLERVYLQQQQQQSGGDGDDGKSHRDVESAIRDATGRASQSRIDTGSSQRDKTITTTTSSSNTSGGGMGFLGSFAGKKATAAATAAAAAAAAAAATVATVAAATGVTAQNPLQGQGSNKGVMGGGLPDPADLSVEEQLEHMHALGIQPHLPGEGKVRFAAFFAVGVRGKMLGSSNNGSNTGTNNGNGHAGGDGKDGNAGGASAGTGVGRGGSGPNVLVKAPVYEL